MGIRMYQEMGLTAEAEAFLAQNVVKVVTRRCECGRVISEGPKIIKSEHHDSFYDDGPDLKTYELKDGKLAKEIIQAEPWSSGPVCFMCLEIDGKHMFEWSEEEVEMA